MRNDQHGFIQLLLLIGVLLGTGLWLIGATPPGAHSAEARNEQQLQMAREALIARAVTDDNRPGSLPCPDLMTDQSGLSNRPNDGKADTLTRDDCPSYLGWLPWATLDLAEPLDTSSNRLWYALSPNLRDDDSAQPINNNTPALLTVDEQQDIAAIIFAPGPALAHQSRPSLRPEDYLEGANTSRTGPFSRQGESTQFNDRLLVLDRQTLMAAVNQRIAGEVRRCVHHHAAAKGSYPWPAPIDSPMQHGENQRLFGKLPLSQPSPGIESMLRETRQQLSAISETLSTVSTPEQQRAALLKLLDLLNQSGALFDQTYAIERELHNQAESIKLRQASLDNRIEKAAANGRITQSERNTIQGDFNTLAPTLSTLISLLTQSGMDIYPNLLDRHQLALEQALASASLPALLAAIDALDSLIATTSSPQTNLAEQLSTVQKSIQSSREAIAQGNQKTGLDSGLQLIQQLRIFSGSILQQRPNRPPESTLPPGDNLTLSSLAAIAQELDSKQQALMSANISDTTQPTPYARQLQASSRSLADWLNRISQVSDSNASLLRHPVTSNTDLPDSAFSLNQLALSSISASGGSLKKLDDLLAAPSNSRRATLSSAALQNTLAQTAALLTTLPNIENQVHGTQAQAFPMIWASRYCNFLQITTEGSTWWQNNHWADTTFYQISQTDYAQPGNLQVDGQGQYALIVINAGSALDKQNRASALVSNYLEGGNADPSRDNAARTPSRYFENKTLSKRFNDRLAY